MASLLVGGALVLAGLSEARQCTNLTTPVDISAQTGVFNVTLPNTQIDVSMFSSNSIYQGVNYSSMALTGYETTSGTYNISATFCRPDNSTNSTNQYVQVLSHGSGFDRTYWDLAFNNSFNSYVNSALNAGYATFAYDRLGIGNSSQGDPINEIQAASELAALTAITQQLSNGSIPEVGQAFDNRIVHVGHAQGAEQSMALAAQNPNLTSGLVLTGYSLNTSFQSLWNAGAAFQVASENQPLRFGDMNATELQRKLQFQPSGQSTQDHYASIMLDASAIKPGLNYSAGYLVWASASNAATILMKAPNYDPTMLNYVETTGKQAFSYGDVLSSVATNSSSFTGPVLVLTGENDVPYCGGNCYATGDSSESIPADVASAFSKTNGSNVETYLQPLTGSAINAHLNATAAYQVIQDFLQKNNLS